jgi:hypothetical protein
VSNIDRMTDVPGTGAVSFRYLLPDEGHRVTEAIRAARELLDYVLGDLP